MEAVQFCFRFLFLLATSTCVRVAIGEHFFYVQFRPFYLFSSLWKAYARAFIFNFLRLLFFCPLARALLAAFLR